jgi:hypothetical protein
VRPATAFGLLLLLTVIVVAAAIQLTQAANL